MKPAINSSNIFQDLVIAHLDDIYSVAIRLTRDAVTAEDLVQETLARAFEKFDPIYDTTNFKAWIFKILTNLYHLKFSEANFTWNYDMTEADEFESWLEYQGSAYETSHDIYSYKPSPHLPAEYQRSLLIDDIHNFVVK